MTAFTNSGRNLTRGLALVGLGVLTAIAAGFVADARSFDRTSGGYAPPYTDFTGDPIDWSQVDTTSAGMVARGYVIDVVINCSSGMMYFEAAGLSVPFRSFSERALVVHKPREVCLARGFSPEF
jgi:hypothetical protein